MCHTKSDEGGLAVIEALEQVAEKLGLETYLPGAVEYAHEQGCHGLRKYNPAQIVAVRARVLGPTINVRVSR